MRKVLFVYKHKASWAFRDKEILAKKFNLSEFFVTSKSLLKVSKWIKSVKNTDVVFCWFGSLNFLPILFAAKLFMKKIVIVAGGYDVAKDDKYNHGSYTKSLLYQFLQTQVFKLADKVICISESNRKEAINNAKISPDKITLIPHGFEKPQLKLKSWNERKNQAVLIANVSKDKFFVKGIDQLIHIAKTIPELNFKLIGGIETGCDELFGVIPENLEICGALEFDSEEFNKVLNESKFILQLSHYESFGAAVVDGALRGCLPIVYDQYALGEIPIDSLGHKAEYGNFEEVKSSISSDLTRVYDIDKIQSSYQSKYSLEARENTLNTVLKSL